MKLDLNFNLKNLVGQELAVAEEANTQGSPAVVSHIVANILGAKTKYLTYAKATRIAIDLVRTGATEIDKVDAELLKKEIEEDESLFNFVKAQIIDAIDESIAELKKESVQTKSSEE